jgi:hypothetical protein
MYSPVSPFNYIHIFIYPLIILLLPVNLSSAVVVLFGFICGLLIDLFYSSPGLHTSALVFTAYFRKLVLNLMEPRTGYKVDDKPLLLNFTPYWYLRYAALLMFIHLLFYFSVEYFTFFYLLDIMLNTIMSFVVTMLLIGIHAIIIRSLINR